MTDSGNGGNAPSGSGRGEPGPVMPSGLNHLVINVRDMEASHRFWTEVVGLRQVGQFRPRGDVGPRRAMRFYSADHGGGQMTHHDVALMEDPDLPAPGPKGTTRGAIGHIALALPDRESWLRQLAWLQKCGVPFERRVEHGMTHSAYIRDPNGYSVELLYELPRPVWEGDIDAALNHYVAVPTEGAAALQDNQDPPVFGAR
jgi:catechol 2,3-dioxygenase